MALFSQHDLDFIGIEFVSEEKDVFITELHFLGADLQPEHIVLNGKVLDV
jgi:hypothetical protein